MLVEISRYYLIIKYKIQPNLFRIKNRLKLHVDSTDNLCCSAPFQWRSGSSWVPVPSSCVASAFGIRPLSSGGLCPLCRRVEWRCCNPGIRWYRSGDPVCRQQNRPPHGNSAESYGWKVRAFQEQSCFLFLWVNILTKKWEFFFCENLPCQTWEWRKIVQSHGSRHWTDWDPAGQRENEQELGPRAPILEGPLRLAWRRPWLAAPGTPHSLTGNGIKISLDHWDDNSPCFLPSLHLSSGWG